mgnify:CR=1 FL=1
MHQGTVASQGVARERVVHAQPDLALRGLVVSVFRLERARGFFRKLTLLVSSACVCAVTLESGLAAWPGLVDPAHGASRSSQGAPELLQVPREQAGTDGAHRLSIDEDLRLRHALDQGDHGAPPLRR